jgi:hypothetical protein
MQTRTYLGLISPLLLATVLSGGFTSGFAQTNTTQRSKPAASATTQAPTTAGKGWVRDPNSVMPMRKMTNAERRAAAQRNKVRRQNDTSRRLQRSTNSRSGVQQ